MQRVFRRRANADGLPADGQLRSPWTIPRANASTGELSEYDRRVNEFNQRNPPPRPYHQSRIVSWADPQTARGLDDELRSRSRLARRGASPLGAVADVSEASKSRDSLLDHVEWTGPRRRDLQVLKRRRSFDDADELRGTRTLHVDHMRIDVELCGQLLVMRRREEHLANVLAVLAALTARLSATNATLMPEYHAKAQELAALKARAGVVQEIEGVRARAAAMTQETNALAYESAQFLVDDLWHMAAAPRNKVLAMREHVFGTARRLPQGVRGAHGRFNRLQWTLDGRGRLVDVHGRTESEAEEEEGLPRLWPVVHEEEEDVVEHASLKPTWLLRLFNYWGSKWGGPSSKAADGDKGKEKEKDKDKDKDKDRAESSKEDRKERGKSSSVSSSTSGIELRSTLVRNNTA